MPSKRRYHVKGTNDFIVLAGIFFFLCLWAVKDAWFPSPGVLKKHPLEIAVGFEIAGSVDRIYVRAGDAIAENQMLATLRSDRLLVDFEEAKKVYTAAREKHALLAQALKNSIQNGATTDGIDGLQERLAAAEQSMDESLARVNKLQEDIYSTELRAPSKGVVERVDIAPHSLVEPEAVAMVIDPKGHFYLFNKSLAVFSFFAFWIFLAVHFLGR